MRALFVTGTLGYGGAEGHSINLVHRLAERGYECHAAYIKSAQDALVPRLSGAAGVHGLEVSRYLDFGRIDAFAAHLARLRPTVLLAANPYALLYCRLALQRSALRAPLAVSFHSTRPRDLKEWVQLACYRPLFWTADCVVFVCQAQRRYWQRRGLWGRRTEVIYNGVDASRWVPPPPGEVARIRGALGLAEGDFVLGLCGKFRPEKNHVQLVDAVAALRARGIPAHALLIGDGPLRPGIEARARAAGVSRQVHITGLQSDVRPLLAACDVAVLCSLTETFSIAALEAMALGRPVVHAEVGGAAEMITPGVNGLLFPVADTPALVAGLASLVSAETRRRMGSAGRAAVETHFSERAMVERYEKLLLDLESTRRNRGNIRTGAPAH